MKFGGILINDFSLTFKSSARSFFCLEQQPFFPNWRSYSENHSAIRTTYLTLLKTVKKLLCSNVMIIIHTNHIKRKKKSNFVNVGKNSSDLYVVAWVENKMLIRGMRFKRNWTLLLHTRVDKVFPFVWVNDLSRASIVPWFTSVLLYLNFCRVKHSCIIWLNLHADCMWDVKCLTWKNCSENKDTVLDFK